MNCQGVSIFHLQPASFVMSMPDLSADVIDAGVNDSDSGLLQDMASEVADFLKSCETTSLQKSQEPQEFLVPEHRPDPRQFISANSGGQVGLVVAGTYPIPDDCKFDLSAQADVQAHVYMMEDQRYFFEQWIWQSFLTCEYPEIPAYTFEAYRAWFYKRFVVWQGQQPPHCNAFRHGPCWHSMQTPPKEAQVTSVPKASEYVEVLYCQSCFMPAYHSYVYNSKRFGRVQVWEHYVMKADNTSHKEVCVKKVSLPARLTKNKIFVCRISEARQDPQEAELAATPAQEKVESAATPTAQANESASSSGVKSCY